ncbi:hypothetical protein MKY84_13180 [Chryseomicrobium sp. FSL W7-1435]|uniref:hypothetical protein n=1 Tax=Chryseomicrobium sp. FSL W7-1435 TaxID=2921704 RepID=UPI00315A93A9
MRIIVSALFVSFVLHILYFGAVLIVGLWGTFGFISEMVQSGASLQVLSTQFGFAGVFDVWYFVMTYLVIAAILYIYRRVTVSI